MNAFDQAMMKIFGANWKSTASAYLTVAFTIGGFVTSYLATIPHPTPWEIQLSGGLTTAVAIMKLIVGHMTQDKGNELAVVPGNATPVVVPSHEVPDNPAATPVKEQ